MTKQKNKLAPLKDIHIAQAYLKAILHYNPNDTEQFMIGLRNIVAAMGSKASLAKKMEISQYKLNKTLNDKDPIIFDLLHLLKVLKINMHVKPTEKKPTNSSAKKKNASQKNTRSSSRSK